MRSDAEMQVTSHLIKTLNPKPNNCKMQRARKPILKKETI